MKTPRTTTHRALALAVLGLAVLGASSARAHQINYPKKLTLDLEPGRLTLSIAYDVDGHDAPALRARHDADRDGRIDQDEGERLMQYLLREARRGQELTVAGAALPLTVTSVSDRGVMVEVDSGEHLSIFAILEAPLPASGAWPVTLKDATDEGLGKVPLTVFWRGLAMATSAAGVRGREDDGRATFRGVQLARDLPFVATFEPARTTTAPASAARDPGEGR